MPTELVFCDSDGSGGTSGTLTRLDQGSGITLTPNPVSTTGTVAVTTNGILNSHIRASTGCSVVGRSANSVGDVADIAATADGNFLVRRSGALTFDVLGVADLPALNGFTDATPAGDDRVPIWNLAAGANRDTSLSLLVSSLAASGADQEAAVQNNVIVTPVIQHRHPSASKGWVKWNASGTPAINASYNVSSITDHGLGDQSVNWDTDFSSAHYCATVGLSSASGTIAIYQIQSMAAGSIRFNFANLAYTTFVDPDIVCVSGFGDF